MMAAGFFVNGPYALITTAVSADLGTHKSLAGALVCICGEGWCGQVSQCGCGVGKPTKYTRHFRVAVFSCIARSDI